MEGVSSSPDIPVSLGKPSLRRRLEAYYSLVNPEAIQDPVKWKQTFAQVYEKYGGSYEGELKLASKLAKKYGSTVRLLLAESADPKLQKANRQAKAAAEAASLVKREESWFALRDEERNSGSVDFTSNCFDPLAALTAPSNVVMETNPWAAKSPVLSFVDQFRPYLPTNDPLYRPPSTNINKKSTTSKRENPQRKMKKLGPFESIAENNQNGPFKLLYRLFHKRQRARLVVRYVNGVRGTLTGYIVAYDKHFNMILRDVDEVYSPSPKNNTKVAESVDSVGTESSKKNQEDAPSSVEVELNRRINALQETAINRKSTSSDGNIIDTRWQIRQRHMKQILVRGDNVVMVYEANAERSAWPRTAKSPSRSAHGRRFTSVSFENRVGTPGSLAYAYQQMQYRSQQQQNQQRRSPSSLQRYDYRSSG